MEERINYLESQIKEIKNTLKAVALYCSPDLQKGLRQAYTAGDTGAVKGFISIGSVKNLGSNWDTKLLSQAARDSNIEVMRALIANGTEVNPERDTDIPLHEAISCGTLEAVELLVVSGADVDAADAWGNTPLHIIARNNYAGMVRLLLGADANVNARGIDGWTPLHTAIDAGNAEVAKDLIAAGADLLALTGADSTPFDMASEQFLTEFFSGFADLSDNIRTKLMIAFGDKYAGYIKVAQTES